MQDEDRAVLKSLVAVAWADGRVAEEETEMIHALISAFGANKKETDEILDYAKTPRTLADIPVDVLTPGDRTTVLNHAVVLTFIDGHQDEDEKKLVQDLVGVLQIQPDEASRVIEAAEARARRLLQLL